MSKFLVLNNKKIGIYIDSLNEDIFFYILKNRIIKSFSFSMSGYYLNSKFKSKIKRILMYIKNICFNRKYIIPHSSFYINLGSPIKRKLYFYRFLFIKEVNFCYKLGIKYINFHPGNHLNIISKFDCINNIVESINYVISKTKKVILVLENTSGNGTSLGYSLFQISKIINSINDKSRIGVCIDICHAFSAGYNFSNFNLCEDFFNIFDKLIGIRYIKAIHLNGSKYELNSRKDRHDSLINSKLGNIIFYWIMRNKLFDNLPIILESKFMSLWLKEIKWLNSL